MSAATASSPTSFQNQARPWWMMLIEGVALAIIGAVLLWAPAKTAANTWLFLVTFLGIWWIIRGVLDIVSMFIDHSAWGWKLFMGIISIIAGGYIVMYPIAAAVLLPQIFALILGIWGLVQGIVMLMLAFRGGGWGPGILGVLAIIFGIFLIGAYGDFGMGLAFIWGAAVLALLGGIVMIVQAFRTRTA
ncbi:MAG: DUF308 domain-containing protein [Anaerolineae bacterium]|nr:DUF308 domain-containing protein [Anaerolineae bacterium]